MQSLSCFDPPIIMVDSASETQILKAHAMNCDDFRKLTIFRQVELLFEKGQHVLSRIYLFYNVHLYSLSGFYAEIWYRQADNKIERVIILDQADVLDLYDNQIGLGEITGFISPKE